VKPSDFYLGISEFFSVLVPGFLVTIVFAFLFGEYDFNKDLSALTWVTLAVTSYVVGHILFAIGTKWDKFYDTHKPTGNERLLAKIRLLRNALYSDNDTADINNYQWCRSTLLNCFPDAFMDVARKEADSKLFRSMIVPLMLLSIDMLISFQIMAMLLSAALAYVAYSRYRTQRFKACKAAYTHVITLNTHGKINKPN